MVFTLDQLDRVPQVRGMRAEPKYPPDLKRAGVEGEVQVFLVVETNGRVVEASIHKSSNPGFNQPAIDAVLRWRFEPGLVKGKPVAFKMIAPINFNINR
jgi:protein TonB